MAGAVAVTARRPAAERVSGLPSASDGVLNVRKERGWTSHDVVAKLRGLLRQPKVGHAGTLDPEATGVLPILVGKATRIAEYLLSWDKEYQAVLRLGETTDTLDAAGTRLQTCPVDGVTEQGIREILPQFQGSLRQTPPMYSAVKVGGMPLYKAARAGRTVERQAREVMIHQLDCLKVAGPDVWLRIICSKGTYVRTLCADIGEALGVGGHLLTLERTRVGPLSVERASTVEEIARRLSAGEPIGQRLSLDEALTHLPAVIAGRAGREKVTHGMPLAPADLLGDAEAVLQYHSPGSPVRVKDDAGHLLAIGRVPDHRAGALALAKVLVDTSGADPAPEDES